MKKIIFSLFLLSSVVLVNAQQFTVKGKVDGIEQGQVKIASAQNSAQVISTGEIKNGTFTLTGMVPEPSLYFIVIGNEQPIYLFLENEEISVKGSKKDIKNIKIEGSKSHDDFMEFQKIFNPVMGELNVLASDLQRGPSPQKQAVLMRQYDSVVAVINSKVSSFVNSHPSSFVSPFLIFVTAQLNTDPVALDNYYKVLTPEVKNSGIGRSLGQYVAESRIGAIGTEAMNFTQEDPQGKAISLSSFKGRYVLVDFWASWCRPCRIENPAVVKAYQKFRDRNFTVLGVSLDSDKQAWVKAIEKDNLTWDHVSDLQNWNNAVAQLYKVKSIPQNFLIDPNGKIIARDLRGEALEQKLCELLGGCN